MSRDVAEHVLTRHKSWNFGYMDDVGMGKLMQKLGYSILHSDSLNVASEEDLMAMDTKSFDHVYHFQVRSSGPNGQRNDVWVMNQLHRRLRAFEEGPP